MTELRVRLTPRGGRDAITDVREGTVHARVSAAPVDGKANQALCRLLAKALGVAPSCVSVVRGHGSREKLVRVEGIDTAQAHDRLRPAA